MMLMGKVDLVDLMVVVEVWCSLWAVVVDGWEFVFVGGRWFVLVVDRCWSLGAMVGRLCGCDHLGGDVGHGDGGWQRLPMVGGTCVVIF